MANELRTYTKKEKSGYLIGLTGQNIVYNIIGAGLAYFLQFTVLIPAIAVSVIMAVARVWDAFNDPIMGTIVDRTRSKWGKCRPYLIIMPSIIFVVTVLCFVSFGLYNSSGTVLNFFIVAWAAFTYILWGMTYTIGDIPLWSVTALMTEDDKDRNKLLSAARLFGGIGGGITLLGMQPLSLAAGSWIGNIIGSPANGERFGFLIVAALFALIGCAMFQVTGLSIKERIPASEKKYTLKQNFTIMLKNKPFRQILISGILGSGKMLLSICAMPLVTYYYASKNPVMALVYMILLGGGMFIGMFLGIGLVNTLLKRFTKKNLYNYSNLLAIVPFLAIFIMYLISPAGLTSPIFIVLGFILFFFAGGSTGITSVLQSQMIADCVDYEEYTNGTRTDGVFFSGQTFITKLSAGIATIISGVAYTVVGFSDDRVAEVNAFIDAGGIPKDAPQYSKLMMILFFLISIPAAISCILTVIPTWKYSLDDDVHKKIIDELNRRRHATEEGEQTVAERE